MDIGCALYDFLLYLMWRRQTSRNVKEEVMLGKRMLKDIAANQDGINIMLVRFEGRAFIVPALNRGLILPLSLPMPQRRGELVHKSFGGAGKKKMKTAVIPWRIDRLWRTKGEVTSRHSESVS
ncbi:hypothetical protein BT69DRAFT_1280811 [Atractiella rhizophila]|nr:hypothetical protein BT69DRAFT_1280811 [Atractiella rhizophila]